MTVKDTDQYRDLWAKSIREEVVQFKKFIRRNAANGNELSGCDMTDNMAKRRQNALLNSIPEIYERCLRLPWKVRPRLGNIWRDLNLMFETYSFLDEEYHILHAASVWILDQITKQEDWREVYRLLPRDDEVLFDRCLLDAWYPEYDIDLVYSVEYVLHNRNPVETDGAGRERTLTSDYLAAKSISGSSSGSSKKTDPEAERNRENYKALIAMLPQEAIDRAVEHFRAYFWEWVDRFIAEAMPFMQADAEFRNRIGEMRVRYDRNNTELDRLKDKMAQLRRQSSKKKTPAKTPNPLLVKPQTDPMDFLKAYDGRTDTLDPMMRFDPPGGGNSELEKTMKEAMSLAYEIDLLGQSINALADKGEELERSIRKFLLTIGRSGHIISDEYTGYGEIKIPVMEPMKIADPYEICFALLYLTEADDDLPWLYGAGCALMTEVTENLPWGINEYSEIDDERWMGNMPMIKDVRLPKSVTIPDPYDRSYGLKNRRSDYPRSLAQIIYEETGCVLPRNLHIYDDHAGLLGKYGIRGKDLSALLVLMDTLGVARRPCKPINLDPDIDLDLVLSRDLPRSEEGHGVKEKKKAAVSGQEGKEAGENTETLKEEIRQLKTLLHSSEKENRETKKALAELQADSDREHRELADLREYVFNNSEIIDEEEPEDEREWPYDVQKETVIFGGHPNWLKKFRNHLTGNVRFIAKDPVFDAGIIRRADVIWIQPNALSHSIYYRIVDMARQYEKPVRYFTFGSWVKCAGQLIEEDE